MANTLGIESFKQRPQNIGTKPRAFDTLRRIAQKIAMEEVDPTDWPHVKSRDPVVLAEAILYTWGYSKDSQLEKLFLEVAYGKPPLETRITGPEGEPIIPPSSGFDLAKLSVTELVNLRKIILKAQGSADQEVAEEEQAEQAVNQYAEEVSPGLL